MNDELQKLEQYAKMGAMLPQADFAKSFKEVIRKGTEEEVKQAYELIKNLATITPDLNNFCGIGIEIYKEIRKSHVSYYAISKSLLSFKNSKEEVNYIAFNYSKIQDDYFLQRANILISQHPILSRYIEIRKTKRELLSEKKLLESEFQDYVKNYSLLFERLNQYFTGQFYSSEKTNGFIEELQYLKTLALKYKDILDKEKFVQLLKDFENAHNEINRINDLIKEEKEIWSR